jgi:hypothetical protein
VLYKSGAEGCEKNRHVGLKVESSGFWHCLPKIPLKTLPLTRSSQAIFLTPYSCRIDIQHRLIHEVLEEEKIIKVLRM